MKTSYINRYTKIDDNDNININEDVLDIEVIKKPDKKIGVMIIGIGGNNGSTFTAGLIAYNKKLQWENKDGIHNIEFLGSLAEFGSVNIGYKKNKPYMKLIKDMVPIIELKDIIIGGWDISSDNLYTACKNNKVIDIDLLKKLKEDLCGIVPLKSIHYDKFIAKNQKSRVNNVKEYSNKNSDILSIKDDIKNFKIENKLDDVIVLWSGSTECCTKNYDNIDDLFVDVYNDSEYISPSIIFAIASITSECIFINTSPQNTISPAIIKLAKQYNTFVGGSDLKSGQTKLKSVLVDYLASACLRPLSIVSYNHLGNRDGLNLDETPQFQSKETTKRNVIDDVIDENPEIFKGNKPDHTVVIKYIPSVGDSKRAIDEYVTELFLNGKNILSIYNLCEDSLLAVPIILDIIVLSEFFSRVRINGEKFNSNLSLLSYFFKAPIEDENFPTINSFFKQIYAIKNFIKICNGLPIDDFTNLHLR